MVSNEISLNSVAPDIITFGEFGRRQILPVLFLNLAVHGMEHTIDVA